MPAHTTPHGATAIVETRSARRAGMAGASGGGPSGPPRQLVNRRIRTLRMRPKLANVAMTDDPP